MKNGERDNLRKQADQILAGAGYDENGRKLAAANSRERAAKQAAFEARLEFRNTTPGAMAQIEEGETA